MERKWIRRVLFATIGITAIYFLHPIFLQWLASPLIASSSDQRSVDCVAILSGHDRFGIVESMYKQNQNLHVLVIQGPIDRLTKWKVTEPTSNRDRDALRDSGIPEEQIEVLGFSNHAEWEWARQLHQWIANHPDRYVGVICPQFDSQRTRIILDATATETSAGVSLIPLPAEEFNDRNWWTNRRGLKSFWQFSFDRVYTMAVGEEVPSAPQWDPDDYERQLDGK
ncbi:hypothetical protein [Blastopirellula marina]|uniref:DUF218 domain-containing protein n=1 Tax=Blastopirellula marina TaxID=124 RepID=A0A2S8G0U2_9BACT|nr:hypothetical protein [Blastopirellula marina]PQO38053.1 hypothetical protein C5Y98_08185 [Blastopirellula marina]PTL44709.1 hypothetical protein C5Y97_08185 [Blastopirellula marina]